MAYICLAKIAEVMLPHKIGGCLLHPPDVIFAMLRDEVLIAALHCIEPVAQPGLQYQNSGACAIQHLRHAVPALIEDCKDALSSLV